MSNSSPTILEVLAFISAASFHDAARIEGAAKRRLRDVSPPNISAAEIRNAFPIGSTVELVALTNQGLNGARVRVTGHQAKTLVVDIRGNASRMPAECCILVDGEPDAPADAPITRGDFVRINSTDRANGLPAIIIGSKKSGNLIFVTIDGSEQNLSGPASILTRIDPPAAIATLVLIHKSEYDDVGPATLLDTSKVKPTDMRQIGKDYDGVTKFGYLKRSEARIIAQAYNAKFKEA